MAEKIGIGFIGTGFARNVQMPAFASCEGARIVSVASRSVENARAAAAAFGAEHAAGDWRETVARDDVQLVCITTPPRLHREMTLAALAAGKHVLCEKPMAMNVSEAIEMTSAASGRERLSLIDFELRFQPGRQRAWQMLREGAIGEVRHAKYNFRAPHRGDPTIPWNWWSDKEQGGGALGAINSHVIDSLQWLLGSEVSGVACQLQTHVKKRPYGNGHREVTSDDEALMLLRFAAGDLCSDATGIVSVSMVEQPEYLNRMEIFGTGGAMRIDHRGELYTAIGAAREWTPVEVDLGTTVPGVNDTGFARGFVAFAPRIVEAISAGSRSIEHAATFADGLSVQRVLDAARESDATGRFVSL
jgi:predicted dehydrogenase